MATRKPNYICRISIHALLAESDRHQTHQGGTHHISIHALLAESDTWQRGSRITYVEFLSTLSLRRATDTKPTKEEHTIFLSTLSLRRATRYSFRHSAQGWHFYPRSPCGERQTYSRHFAGFSKFLSTLSLRRATRAANCQQRNHQISIHALLAESDLMYS